jgi:hypothetical protein
VLAYTGLRIARAAPTRSAGFVAGRGDRAHRRPGHRSTSPAWSG